MNCRMRLSHVSASAALLLGLFCCLPSPSQAQDPSPAPSAAGHTSARLEREKEPKPAGKSQAELALKTAAFAAVAAANPALKSARKATDLAGAKAAEGKGAATFIGTIARVFAPRSNTVVILNFAKDYRSAVSAVVFAKNFAAFPPLAALEGKTVLVTGAVQDYQGSPEIVLTAPGQVKVVK